MVLYRIVETTRPPTSQHWIPNARAAGVEKWHLQSPRLDSTCGLEMGNPQISTRSVRQGYPGYGRPLNRR